ncbi:MAG: hypothetical protein IKL60_03290 [Alistipes sp.]|nr:hypothetical protein [Alistipes sp.]
MKRVFLVLLGSILTATALAHQLPDLPKRLYTDGWRAGHVQGIAVDTKQEYIYLSFTTILVKMDMKGNVVGTVTGILGHLGCLEFNEDDGRLYGSLEYKNDVIGRDILKQEGVTKQLQTGFYVAIFDVEKITRHNMSAERDGVMTSVLLKSVVEDFEADVKTKSGKQLKHRHGCSGFDGISFGPAFDGSGERLLTIAYGIYGDTERTDNNYQVLLQYNTKDWAKYEAPLSQEKMHSQGPAQPQGKYFVFTGNTTWGVQNLEYDKSSNCWFLACYPGKKSAFSNYTLFSVNGSKRAKIEPLQGVDYQERGAVLTLSKRGNIDPKNRRVRGWHNKLGAVGMCALGNGYFYLAEGGKNERGRSAEIHLMRFVGSPKDAFRPVE